MLIRKMATLLDLGILFLVIAFLAYVFGARGVAGFSMEIAKILIVLFLILFALSVLFGLAFNI
jgi:uncharacterized membrane protein YtjA (UPF0391 family)